MPTFVVYILLTQAVFYRHFVLFQLLTVSAFLPVKEVVHVAITLQMLQIHTMPYPDGAIKGTFNSSSIISEPVPAVYGAALIDPFTGELCMSPPLDVTTLDLVAFIKWNNLLAQSVLTDLIHQTQVVAT